MSQQEGDTSSARVTATVPRSYYAELQRIAKEKRVSIAWVIRDAIREYVESKLPLFRGQL